MPDFYDKYIKALFEFEKVTFTEGELEYLKNKVRNAIRGKYCVDNFRSSVHKKDKQYLAQYHNGCCGFWDEEVVLKSGIKVYFGFNYGH